MKIKRWRKKAQNREEWASIINKAKVLKGL
jgi:hypothetical protein